MSSKRAHVDKPLAILLILLVVSGLFIFASALFGPLAQGDSHISSVAFNHLIFGVGMGLIALFASSFINYRIWRRFAPHLFLLALVATALVFVTSLGFEHGGGRRWIVLFDFTFQPSEALKIATVIMVAAYFSAIRARITQIRYGLGGFLALLAVPSVLLVLQPDIGTLGIIVLSTGAVFLAAGARLRDIAVVICIGLIVIATLTVFKEHVRDRVQTFFTPSRAPQAQGWQVRQSLIAIGSGGLTGRGFGQSVQKFTDLPEPMGDSIFAIAGEEFGFIGAVFLIILFLAFALRGFTMASRTTDAFGAYLAIGIASYLTLEAFVNIAGMLGVLPLTGVPLTFISQGGSAMLVSLFSAGILLNISKYTHN